MIVSLLSSLANRSISFSIVLVLTTPYCITVDFDTVGDEAKGIAADNCVTVRDRDTMEQVRMPISELKSYIESKIEF